MVFFTDWNIGARKVPQKLRDAGIHVETHIDHFDQDAPDEVWIPEVAKRGWIILTYDATIARTPHEIEAVRRSGAALLILVGANARAEDQAANFLNSLGSIKRLVERTRRPYIAKLYRPPHAPESILEGKPGCVEIKHPPWPTP